MKITLHRALARVKTTNERLANLIVELRTARDLFLMDIYSNKYKNCILTGKSQADTEKLIYSSWDKFNSLYNELVQLKKAITLSNAGVTPETKLEKVTVCGKEYTIAELIVLQNVFDYKKQWLSLLKELNTKVKRRFDDRVNSANEKLEQHISMMLGSDAKKSDVSVEGFTEAYLKQNGFSLVDPLNLSKKIEELEKEISDYEVESDAALSEANALRTIELEVA